MIVKIRRLCFLKLKSQLMAEFKVIIFLRFLLWRKKESIYLQSLLKIAFHKGYKENGGVVQLVRISACHAEGREFESRRHRKKSSF